MREHVIEQIEKNKLIVIVRGKVSAQVFDESGARLGRSQTFTGDSTKAKLCFEDLSITELNDKVIFLRFEIDGELYAFGFADANGDFGGAHAAGVVE